MHTDVTTKLLTQPTLKDALLKVAASRRGGRNPLGRDDTMAKLASQHKKRYSPK